jgi:hypothetical protein
VPDAPVGVAGSMSDAAPYSAAQRTRNAVSQADYE